MRVIGVRNIESWCTLQCQVVNEKHQALSIEWALFPIGLIKSWMSRSCRKKRTQTASVFIASMTSRHRGCFRDFRKMVAKTGSWNLPMLPLYGVVCRGCLSRCDKPFIAAGLIFWTELWLVYCHQHHHRLFLFCFDLPREWEMSFRLSFSLCRCRACKVGVAMLTCFW